MEKLAEPKEAALKLGRVYFTEISYSFHAEKNARFKYAFNFERELEEFGDSKYRVYLKCNVQDEKNEVELHIEIVGEFECALEDEGLKQRLLSENAVAILFPYLRSQICLVTTQPYANPINLPAINVLSLFGKS